MKKLIFFYLIWLCFNPVYSVTTRMFRVLDTCARYRVREINSNEALEKLKLKFNTKDQKEAEKIIKNYCSVFTPNEKIEY